MYWTNDELMDFRMAFAVYCGYGMVNEEDYIYWFNIEGLE
jgi:hypothetical protein